MMTQTGLPVLEGIHPSLLPPPVHVQTAGRSWGRNCDSNALPPSPTAWAIGGGGQQDVHHL